MEQILEQVKNECLANWGEIDNRLQSFSDNFGTWIDQIPEENQKTVLILLRNLSYYSHKKTNEWLMKLHQQLKQNPKITDENTIYTFIKSNDGYTSSSIAYWLEYMQINDLSSRLCYTDTDRIGDKAWACIENIVFIDDFSGSGDTFIDEIDRQPERYKNKNIYFIIIDIMRETIIRIQKHCKSMDINCFIISAFQQDKAFEKKLFNDEKEACSQIKGMSERLNIPSSHIMGYKNSQALVAFYNNTPNNTLGFIRYNTDKYTSIFPRKNDATPEWLRMQKRERGRKNANYSNMANEGR